MIDERCVLDMETLNLNSFPEVNPGIKKKKS